MKTIRFVISDVFLPPYSKKGKRLLLVKTEAIGDFLLFRNFIESVRKSKKFHDYEIFLIGNEAWRPLAESWDSNWVDRFIWINRKRFVDESAYRKSILTEIRNLGISIAVQANFSREVLLGDSIIRSTGTDNTWGSEGDAANDLPVFKKLADSWYSKLLSEPSIPLFEFDKNKIFFECFLEENIPFAFPFTPDSWNKPAELSIAFFPGAGEKIKQWPISSFINLIKSLVEKYPKAKFLVLGGPGDFEMGNEIESAFPDLNVENFCGKTSLMELSKVISTISLLVTNDSSAYHFAAASGTPQVCLLMGRHFARFSPYPASKGKIIEIYPERFNELRKNPIQTAVLTQYSSPCTIEEIELKHVLQASIDLLEDESFVAR